MKKLLIFVLTLITYSTMTSQSIADFQWKNRLIVVFTDSINSQKFQEQLELFKNEMDGFNDRKLKLIHHLPHKKQIVLPEVSEWQDSSFYKKNKKKKAADFEVILIGLDGGVKLRQYRLVETKEIFDLIDSMPMRQSEIRENN
ncbi:DUF4174 domain-containing protein [Christiangramia sediminis]|uniref:DUF4174 domain-containing protein n=1 Tax=Christiangramia sediminis TaxID=2881336 RepID=A0A9X1LJW0_9FLAO|nr:DUF4174 domain-containing protein [Christiangramia sediminis]MCB7481711.1 DUF4174 domain-containing protein [Christiangramia sediminis]